METIIRRTEAYGRIGVYYWKRGLEIASYHFEPVLQRVPERSWREGRQEVTVRGYSRKSKRFRAPLQESTLNLVRDFYPTIREAWKSKGFVIPNATLFTVRSRGKPAANFPSSA